MSTKPRSKQYNTTFSKSIQETLDMTEEAFKLHCIYKAWTVYAGTLVETCKNNATEYFSKESIEFFRKHCIEYINTIADGAQEYYKTIPLKYRKTLEMNEILRNDSCPVEFYEAIGEDPSKGRPNKSWYNPNTEEMIKQFNETYGTAYEYPYKDHADHIRELKGDKIVELK